MPGSPIALAHLRLGLPLPSMPDPTAFTDAEWDRQGHEVRSCLDYAWVEDQLYVRVAWDDSWEPAASVAGLDELRLLQQRRRQAGDDTDIWAIAKAAREAEEQAAAALAAEQQAATAEAAQQPAAGHRTSAA